MANTADMPIIIKKYANRRLYNTATSQYITQDDLRDMVRENVDFKVQDAKTSKDLTHNILIQIIFEQENNATDSEPMLPVNFLRRIIALYGDSTQAVFSQYLDSSMSAFTENQEIMREYLKPLAVSTGMVSSKGFGVNKNISDTITTMTRNNMSMFQNMLSPFKPKSIAEKPPEALSPEQELSQIEKQLQQLQQRIAVIQNKQVTDGAA